MTEQPAPVWVVSSLVIVQFKILFVFLTYDDFLNTSDEIACTMYIEEQFCKIDLNLRKIK